MTVQGTVSNGVIVLDPPGSLPEGARVTVTVQVRAGKGMTFEEVTRMIERYHQDPNRKVRTKEEIDADLQALRDEAEEEFRAVEALHGLPKEP